MMTRKRAVAAIATTALLSQCGLPNDGFGNRVTNTRAMAAASRTGTLTKRESAALHHLKWPQSHGALVKRFGEPIAISRPVEASTSGTYYYSTGKEVVRVRFNLEGGTGLVNDIAKP
jgi:hypothetical protein